MSKVIKVAGTSYGGSSYMLRIVREANKCKRGDKLVVEVGPGEYQDAVITALAKQAAELNSLMARYGGHRLIVCVRAEETP